MRSMGELTQEHFLKFDGIDLKIFENSSTFIKISNVCQKLVKFEEMYQDLNKKLSNFDKVSDCQVSAGIHSSSQYSTQLTLSSKKP